MEPYGTLLRDCYSVSLAKSDPLYQAVSHLGKNNSKFGAFFTADEDEVEVG